MAARRVVVALATAAATAVVTCGCGGGGGASHTPSLAKLPLVPGGTVVAQVRDCNGGANGFCAYELVVVNKRYGSSRALVLAQRDLLRRHGWTGGAPDTGDEIADDSPGHKLRVTYATAIDDLKGVDVGWITRSWPIQIALDRTLFDRSSAMSLLLEEGPQ